MHSPGGMEWPTRSKAVSFARRCSLQALLRACRAYGLGERFLAAAQEEGTFGEWLDELPFEVAAATARLLKHHARSGAWIEITPGSPSQARRAGRDRDRGPHLSPNCPPDMSEPSDYSD